MYRIFLADSDAAERDAIRSALPKNAQFVIVGESGDGESALSMIRDLCPDILIADANLPFMDGLKLAGAVRRNFPWVEIVLLSGYDDPGSREKAKRAGAAEYLIKPASAYELSDAVSRAAGMLETTGRTLEERIRRENLSVPDDRRLGESGMAEWLKTGEIPPGGPPWQTGGKYARMLTLRCAGARAAEIAKGILRLMEREYEGEGWLYAIDLPWGATMVVTKDDKELLENRAYGAAYTALRAVEKFTGERAFVRIGRCVDTLEDLRDSWAELWRMTQETVDGQWILGAGDAPGEIGSAREYIDRSFSSAGLTPGRAAREAGMTVNRFCVMFEQETGMSFTEYLFIKRMSEAKLKLRGTKMRISGVAREVGFADSACFASMFYHHTGVTPQAYRKNHMIQ